MLKQHYIRSAWDMFSSGMSCEGVVRALAQWLRRHEVEDIYAEWRATMCKAGGTA